MLSNMLKMRRPRSSCACSKYYPGLSCPFIDSVVSNNSVSEGPDQTARMRRLIWFLSARICLKSRFRRARPNYILWRNKKNKINILTNLLSGTNPLNVFQYLGIILYNEMIGCMQLLMHMYD